MAKKYLVIFKFLDILLTYSVPMTWENESLAKRKSYFNNRIIYLNKYKLVIWTKLKLTI